MLHNISWHTYLLTVALLMAAYYLVVVSLCYKPLISSLIKGEYPSRANAQPTARRDTDDYPTLPEGLIAVTHSALQNAPPKITKGQLVALLQSTLSGPLARASPDDRLVLFRYIMHESEAACGIRFTGEDLAFLGQRHSPDPSTAASLLLEPLKNTTHVQ